MARNKKGSKPRKSTSGGKRKAGRAGSGRPRRGVYFVVEPDRSELEELARRADAGALRPVVGEVLDLADGARVFAVKRGGGVPGKVVLRIAEK